MSSKQIRLNEVLSYRCKKRHRKDLTGKGNARIRIFIRFEREKKHLNFKFSFELQLRFAECFEYCYFIHLKYPYELQVQD